MAEDGIVIWNTLATRQTAEDPVLKIFRDASFQTFDGSDVGLETTATRTAEPDDGGGLTDVMPGDDFWF